MPTDFVNVRYFALIGYNTTGSVPEYPAEARAAGGGAGRWPDPRVLPSGKSLL